ncbi:MAG: hypothetical protein A3J62_03445 [Candidatus Buchananbacteria bacterium RIFCSPHIGHO2_02_FULL_38_8]|uniref:Peptidase C39-like domain-containing protein n=2 Tax=Candidatus Buchananiibacteriota TaxID=1817903 RepID=A0A1G1XSX1_9BACT|nr:MAG: hypothetical protein A2731_03535 [Candidatus Buchananbacteria bacterium RIFCSPHIGHO2_01_FULL_39_8]OGY47218.1 MAG: hypothetical protein A3J62_03445 [Candidatus Buchananbacteria bacterium RIFCSPHIGHO2_02_FULL_38_8]
MKFGHFLTIILAAIFLSGCQKAVVNQSINQPIELPLINNQKVNPTPTSTPETPKDRESQNQKPVAVVQKAEIPVALDYPVLFAPQAPYAVWDDLHKEACEEAAMIMVAKYFEDESLSAHLMEQAILNLVKWEGENGYKVDLTAQEIKEILNDYFNLKAELIEEVTPERIKLELAKGNLIIVPAAGRQLGNPYFQTPGPIYHMLVIRGYDDDEFITNDPGTKRGEGFRYKYQKLINAIHDWNHNLAINGMDDEEIEQGKKVMIVVQPERP